MSTTEGEVSCNLENVYVHLSKGLVDDDDVSMVSYLSAYKELYNFFVILGKAFQFVASDVETKIKILENHRESAKGTDNFESIKKMIEYEKNNNLLNDSKYVSGSRTLLRLHRGLDFVRQFLGSVHTLEDTSAVGGVCKEAYDKTLGNYHVWAVRTAATFAMKFLPSKQALIAKITREDEAVAKRLASVMPNMLDMMAEIFNRVDALYTRHDLHSLK